MSKRSGRPISSVSAVDQNEVVASNDVWLPPYMAISQSLGVDLTKSQGSTVTVDVDLLLLLLRTAVRGVGFDANYYLAKYPDVKLAATSGVINDLLKHFVETGYFEGRLGSPVVVDEDWYRSFYPDVDDAITNGRVMSAAEHYNTTGVREWRSPNKKLLPVINAWRQVLVS